MLRVAWKGLLAHKLRFLLTGVSVILGIAFMTGTLVLTSTINKTFDDLFAEIFAGTDVQVRGVETVESAFGPGGTQRALVDAAVLVTVRGVDGVAVANPGVDVPYAQLVDKDGEEIGGGVGPPSFGFSFEPDPDLSPFRLEPGSAAPATDDEVVIDRGSADEGDFSVGDRVDVLTAQATKRYTISGIAKFGTQDSALGANVIQFTLAEAQRINGMRTDQFSNIGVVGVSGESQEALRDRIADAIADLNVEVVTGDEVTEENQDDVEQILDIFNQILLIFAGIGLLVACFIIYNTFSIIVAQRTREMALLRAVGASTRQVNASILVESLAVGIVAAALGLGLGVLLAIGLKAALDAFGLDVPASGIVVPPVAVVAAFAVGIVVTVVSAIVPARKASRVPPLAAIRDVAVEQRRRFGRRLLIGAAITITGAALMLYALFATPDNTVVFVGVGAVAIFVGMFVVGPVIARPLSRWIGAPLPATRGITGALARENAMRNPRRTSATAAALMIGVALVGFITIFAASAKESIAVTLERELRTDFIVGPSSFIGGGFGVSPSLAEGLATLPEVGAVSPIRYSGINVAGESAIVTAIDASTVDELLDLGVREGSLSALTTDGVAVSQEWADDNGHAVGDVLPLEYSGSGLVPATVQAVYEGSEVGNTGDFVISIDAFDEHFLPQQRLDFIVLGRYAPGVTPEDARAAIEPLLEPYPTMELQSNAEYRELQEQSIDQVVNIIYVLLALAVVIALIGIANTLALSIYERTRELGLLRAVGMSRSQVRSTVRWESVIIAVLGSLLGLVIGLFFGWAAVRAVREEGFTEFAVAPMQLLLVVVLAVLGGVIFAMFPARRAARLDILQAIATE
ncbi:MAG: ABC transporter permease [Acidimicrobiia bacterium]